MSAIYISLPFLPLEIRSKLDNIFLAQIADSSDIKEFGTKIVYDNIIKQLNDLEQNGIMINVAGHSIKIFFKLALIVGDNLGLNSMLGFTTSFNADSFCRFCKVTEAMSTKLIEQDDSLLRTKLNYDSDVLRHDSQKTGIKEYCAWNKVNNFHVAENYSVDIMHDLLEGVCNYDLGLILHDLIISKKLLTLDNLNFKIKFFQYLKNSIKLPTITCSQLNNK